MYYVGIDIGKRRCAACVTEEDGTILRNLTYSNTRNSIGDLALLLKGYGRCSAVLESTGNLWLKTYEVLEEHGIPVKLANPVKTRAIAEARIKTDKLTARILAHLLRADLIPECYIPSREERERRNILRHRSTLIKARTAVRNQVHSLLDKYDKKCPYRDAFSKKGHRWLEKTAQELEGADRYVLMSHLRRLQALNNEVEEADSLIAWEASTDEDARLLMTMTGVSHYGALLLVSEIGDITRFPSANKLVSWAGLCPSLHQSGDTTRHGRMKKGNRYVTWMMVQAAHSASMHDPEMKKLYQRTRARHGHQKAVIRVANKMLKIIWCMLTQREPYRDMRDGLYKSKLKRMERIAGSGQA